MCYYASMDIDIYASLGLTEYQTRVYSCLIQQGPKRASVLARLSKLPRTMVYIILNELIKLELVEKQEAKKSVATFSARHPIALKTLAEERLKFAEKSVSVIDQSLAAIISAYGAHHASPGIRIEHGIEGVEQLYKDILKERTHLCLIRSPKDAHRSELDALVKKQIEMQVAAAIHVRALTPPRAESDEYLKAADKKRNMERRVLDYSNYAPPAQVILYADKVALTSYGDTIITTVIQNKEIHATFHMLFEVLWTTAKKL
jgi:sugar-specific transcriptional regulator TrmB